MRISRNHKARLFTQYLPLAQKIAGNYARKHHVCDPIRRQELVNDAISALGMIVAEWGEQESSKGFNGTVTPITWIYNRLNWHMLSGFDKEMHRQSLTKMVELPEDKWDTPVAKSKWFDTLLHNLGEDARIIVKTIVDAPREIIEDMCPRHRKKVPVRLQEYLAKKQGWTPEKFDHAWQEVANCL